jgi:hypothetical protein
VCIASGSAIRAFPESAEKRTVCAGYRELMVIVLIGAKPQNRTTTPFSVDADRPSHSEIATVYSETCIDQIHRKVSIQSGQRLFSSGMTVSRIRSAREEFGRFPASPSERDRKKRRRDEAASQSPVRHQNMSWGPAHCLCHKSCVPPHDRISPNASTYPPHQRAQHLSSRSSGYG